MYHIYIHTLLYLNNYKPKVTKDYVSQIAEKQETIASLTTEIASITANIDTLKVDLGGNRCQAHLQFSYI